MATIIQALTFNLAVAIDATQTSIQVRNFKDSRGNPITSMPAGASLILATIEPRSNSNQENISFNGITDNGNGIVTLTGVIRNLNPAPPYEALTGTIPHGNNAEVILSNSAPFYAGFLQADADVVITGDFQFPTPTDPANAATKGYADALVSSGAADADEVTKGISRLSVSPDVTLGVATISITTPAIVSFVSHGLTANDTVRFTTTGNLPTGLSVGVDYYVIAAGLGANSFRLSATLGGAAINTTGSQSGVHTLIRTTPRALGENDPRVFSSTEKANALAAYANFITMTGIFVPYAGFTPPSGWLLCNGAAVSRGTYATLFNVLNPLVGTFAVTIASPAVFTLTSHGREIDDAVYFTTTSALPTGLSINTVYYIIAAGFTANTFQVSTTRGGAAVVTTGSQVGTHSMYYCPYGIGDGTTTFNVPDLRARSVIGRGAGTLAYSLLPAQFSTSTDIITVNKNDAIFSGTPVVLTTNGTMPSLLVSGASASFSVDAGGTITGAAVANVSGNGQAFRIDSASSISFNAGQTYYVINYSAGVSFQLSTTRGGVATGTGNSGTGSGSAFGLVSGTTYYAIRISETTIKLAATVANAIAATPVPIVLFSQGTGVHTLTMPLSTRINGDYGGQESHALTVAELPAHSHTINRDGSSSGSGMAGADAGSFDAGFIGDTGGNTAHNVVSPFVAGTYIIKT
jgi:microcystin-dependent protein